MQETGGGMASSHTEKDICTTLADCYSSISRLLLQDQQHVTTDDVIVANMEDQVNRLLERYDLAYQKAWALELQDIDHFFNRVVLSKEYDQGKLKPATEYYEQFIGEARKLAAYMKSPKDKQVVLCGFCNLRYCVRLTIIITTYYNYYYY